MVYGILGKPVRVDMDLPYAAICNNVADRSEFPPCLLYAIAWRETLGLLGEAGATYISGDGGHGICQLTSSWPPDWADSQANFEYAYANFLRDALTYWAGQGYAGDALVKLVADEYNAGRGNTIAGHDQGNADMYSTNDYGSNVLRIYHQLIEGQQPTL